MSKCRTLLVGAVLALTASFVWGQGSVPVIDRSGAGAAPLSQAAAAVPDPQPVPMSPQTNQLVQLLMTVDQLQEEVRFLRGQVEEQDHQLKRMKSDQRDRYRDLDRRISLLTQRLSESSQPAPLPTLAPAASAEVIVSGDSTSQMTDEQAYRQAFAHVRQRAFDQALAAFADFERNYGSSSLLGNVYYWIGEVYRAKPQPDQQQAQFAYQRLLERFPDHAKTPEATYKLGLTHDALGNRAKALEVMQTVIDRYPEQQSARLAREFLSKN